MAKFKVQAQHLQPGDIVGTGAVIQRVVVNSTQWPSNKVCVTMGRDGKGGFVKSVLWGKYTMINVEREEKV